MNTLNITNYKPKDFAELLGVSVKTLQRWDREGTLKANRTPTDRRYYTYDQYLQFKGINTENDNRQIVIYARVSTRNQKDALQNQVTFLPSVLPCVCAPYPFGNVDKKSEIPQQSTVDATIFYAL